ncbi:MAG: preprotein translocase subunit SecG [Phycisphaerae bacterium]
MVLALSFIFIFIAVLLVMVVLVQRGRGGGLSGAFGAGGGTTAAFGTKTGDVFTTLTVVLFVIFMLLAIWLNFKFRDTVAVAATAPAAGAPTPADVTPMSTPDVPNSPAATESSTAPAITPTSAPASQPR